MDVTPYHAKYFAHGLTKRCPSDSIEKLAEALVDAQVDLNPHQVEAALLAVRSPLSKGAVLADEVGLGKTIEAGILLAEKWADENAVFWSSCRPICANNGAKSLPINSSCRRLFWKPGRNEERSSAAI